MTRTTVLRHCGQSAIGPSGVWLQSKARVRSPISPPPARQARGSRSGASSSSLWYMPWSARLDFHPRSTNCSQARDVPGGSGPWPSGISTERCRAASQPLGSSSPGNDHHSSRDSLKNRPIHFRESPGPVAFARRRAATTGGPARDFTVPSSRPPQPRSGASTTRHPATELDRSPRLPTSSEHSDDATATHPGRLRHGVRTPGGHFQRRRTLGR